MVHCDIKAIKAFVHESALYDEDLEKKSMIPCTIFCISSYKGEAITFGILLDEGSVFFYVPPHKVSVKKEEPLYDLKDLVYNNCESEIFTIKEFKRLREKQVDIYLKNKDKWVMGEYELTIDWYEGNDLVHMIKLETGEFCFLPSHKLKFDNTEKKFNPFLKMHSEWKV